MGTPMVGIWAERTARGSDGHPGFDTGQVPSCPAIEPGGQRTRDDACERSDASPAATACHAGPAHSARRPPPCGHRRGATFTRVHALFPPQFSEVTVVSRLVARNQLDAVRRVVGDGSRLTPVGCGPVGQDGRFSGGLYRISDLTPDEDRQVRDTAGGPPPPAGGGVLARPGGPGGFCGALGYHRRGGAPPPPAAPPGRRGEAPPH